MARETFEDTMKINIPLIIFGVFLFIALLVAIFGSFTIVPAGHRGVVLQFGKVAPYIFGEGFNWKVPIRDSVIPMSNLQRSW